MNRQHDETSEGLNQLFEIINAKGDTGELEKIVKGTNAANKAEAGDRQAEKGK
ncbi:MAG TPA: hypothetical protein VIG80_15880 [Bacillaceae bacterium]